MCLAVPMRLIEIADQGDTGVCELEGARLEVNTSLVDNPRPGEYLIVHAGFAIEKLDEAEADERLQLFSEMAATYSNTGQHVS